MMNKQALENVNMLCKKYKSIYGKEVDLTIIPQGISIEKIEKCLELIIADNLSLLMAYKTLYK